MPDADRPAPLSPEERIDLLDTIRTSLGTDACLDKRGYNEAMAAVRRLEVDAERAARGGGLRETLHAGDRQWWRRMLSARNGSDEMMAAFVIGVINQALASPAPALDAHVHVRRFDGDDPYLVCACGARWNALTGEEINAR